MVKLFNPGMRSEGVYPLDNLLIADALVRTRAVTFATRAERYVRGTVVVLTAGVDPDPDATEYTAYAGGDIAEGSLIGIVVDEVDASAGAAPGFIYIACDVNEHALVFADGGTADAIRDRAALQSIYLHDAVQSVE